MIDWPSLNKSLTQAGERYGGLADRFREFAELLEHATSARNYPIKGISVLAVLNEGYFDVGFAGRTTRFVFTSHLDGSGALTGKVESFLLRKQHQNEMVALGQFAFARSGQTNLRDPEYGEPLSMTDELGAVYLALTFVHDALAK